MLGIQIHTLEHRFTICLWARPKPVSLFFCSYGEAFLSLLLESCYHLLRFLRKFRCSLSHNAMGNFLLKAAKTTFPFQPRPYVWLVMHQGGKHAEKGEHRRAVANRKDSPLRVWTPSMKETFTCTWKWEASSGNSPETQEVARQSWSRPKLLHMQTLSNGSTFDITFMSIIITAVVMNAIWIKLPVL